jgi:hypothetical protein
MATYDPHEALNCSFCGRSQQEARKLIAGPTVFVCDECIALLARMVATEFPGWLDKFVADFNNANTLIGGWSLDSSKWSDGGYLPESELRCYEAIPSNGMRMRVMGVDQTGIAYEYQAEGAIDGKDYPLTGTRIESAGDTISWSRLDRHTVDAVVKKQGSIVSVTRTWVSADATVLTTAEKGRALHELPRQGLKVYAKI